MVLILILIIYPLHTVADGGQHLVRNGLQDIAESLDRQMFTKDLNAVALLAVDARHIDHRHIHTDVAYIICLLTIDQTVGMAIAETAVQAISISDRNGSDDTVLIEDGLATVAHTIARLHVVHLENGSLQGAHAVDGLVVAGVDAIESETQAAHIQLALREVLDTCRIADMAQDLMVEGSLQLSAGLVEQFKLMGRELVEVIAVGPHEV